MIKRLRTMWLRWGLILTAGAVVTACGKPIDKLPPPPTEVIEASVAIPVACEIEQVPVPSYPAQQARKGDDIFTLSKIIAADRKVRHGENVELRAANTGGCG